VYYGQRAAAAPLVHIALPGQVVPGIELSSSVVKLVGWTALAIAGEAAINKTKTSAHAEREDRGVNPVDA